MNHMDYDAYADALEECYERGIVGKTCILDCCNTTDYERCSDGKAFKVCERHDIILHDTDNPRSMGCDYYEGA